MSGLILLPSFTIASIYDDDFECVAQNIFTQLDARIFHNQMDVAICGAYSSFFIPFSIDA